MTTIYMATDSGLVVIRSLGERWQAEMRLAGLPTDCVAIDPLNPARLYCGTFGQGMWQSSEAGESWQPVGEGIPHAAVTAVAVSLLERVGDYGVIWAGTEPSALFRSEDNGKTWQGRPTLRELPSAPTWSFPPRPWTSHVRWIAPDPNQAERLFVGIELGGVMRSLDSGLTWEDYKPNSQRDSHHIRTHPLAPGRIYESAGGGYAESYDGGSTWHRQDEGMRHHYLWGLAIDPADPETIVISAAYGPRQAHDPQSAEATIYRRTGRGPWEEIRSGLPEPEGTRVYGMAANPNEPHVFYAGTHEGDLYRSPDAGLNWEKLNIDWPGGKRPHSGMPPALVVV